MAGGSHMQSSFNSIKLENPGYYCNSYTPPGPADHHAMIPASGYSKFIYVIYLLVQSVQKILLNLRIYLIYKNVLEYTIIMASYIDKNW